MIRALVLATLAFVVPQAIAPQAPGVLRIKIVLLDADQRAMPVARHALLISDNPASAAPRRIVTALDGTAVVNLRPGNYTVESDQPVAFNGKVYQWMQLVDIAAGRDAVLELTTANAESAPAPASSAATTATPGAPMDADAATILTEWQDRVVAIWTPTSHASGLIADPRGLIATNQQVIGAATSVEVELTPTIKVAAIVLVADAARDLAVLWIDPKALASMRPVTPLCAQPGAPISAGQTIFAIGTPLRGHTSLATGTISRVGPHLVDSDLVLPSGGTGGPAFGASGSLAGITTPADQERAHGSARVVRIDDACAALGFVEAKMKGAALPSEAHLPVEPVRPFPLDALKAAGERRAGSLNPYQMTSSDFDIAFITPVMTYGAQYQADQASGRERGGGGARAEAPFLRPLMNFGNWSAYIADFPPVLLVRVTPRMVESFWTTVGRAAASTQGVSLPPIKHFKSGFSRMRAFCGETEVTPIHPFLLEQRISDTEAMYEGLYVFDPGALGPQCGTVKLVLFSAKEPGKADTRPVDPKVVQQIWDDFAPYRVR